MLGALCATKGPAVFIACRDEILKNVSENLERKLPDPCEIAEGLVYKLTGTEKDTEQDTVSVSTVTGTKSWPSSEVYIKLCFTPGFQPSGELLSPWPWQLTVF